MTINCSGHRMITSQSKCGCCVTDEQSTGTSTRIHRCKLHKFAEEMFVLLQDIQDEMPVQNYSALNKRLMNVLEKIGKRRKN